MKKVLVFALAVVMVMSLAVPAAAALASKEATVEDLHPVLTEKSMQIVELVSTEEVQEKPEEVQTVMVEAKEQLAEACPEGFAVKYFFYVEIIGTEKTTVSVDFEAIVENVSAEDSNTVDMEAISKGRIVFMQFVDGKWVELEFVINEDGTITVFNVVEGPISIFTKY